MITNTNHYVIPTSRYAETVARNWNNPKYFSRQTHLNLIKCLAKEVNSDLSHSISKLLEAGDFDNLVDVSINPTDYTDPENFLGDAQLVALIKKYPYWNINTDPKLEAMKTFIACERLCEETNHRILSGRLSDSPTVHAISAIAQRKISRILGEVPSPESIPFKFGPGAAFSVKNNTSALQKLKSSLDVTPGCYKLAADMLLTCPGWREDRIDFSTGPQDHPRKRLNIIQGDRLAFVPKTAKTDRPICINGTVNAVIQKGIGTVIRERLKPTLDLRTAQIRHRRRACLASITQEYATIDLKSASDTISYAVVMDLLPWDWFHLLDQSRSARYMIEDKWYNYHKFSAMGNGYTFELETLIFYALADSVREHMKVKGDVLVYGDDIILPTECAGLLTEVLAAFGFMINTEKSFSKGQFRESCGGDYMNGIDVRPFYLKDHVTIRTLFLFHNQLVRSGNQFRFPETFEFIRRLLGKRLVREFRGPNVEGDGHLVDDSLPVGSYNYIRAVKAGRKSRGTGLFGLSYGLYRLMHRSSFYVLRAYIGSNSSPPPDEFERITRLNYKASVHRYI